MGNQHTAPQQIVQPVQVQRDKSEIEGILLGGLESGKSTFFKQIKKISSNPEYDSVELKTYKSFIFYEILRAMYNVCLYRLKNEKESLKGRILDEMEMVVKICGSDDNIFSNKRNMDSFYTIDIQNSVRFLWKDQKCQEILEKENYNFETFEFIKS